MASSKSKPQFSTILSWRGNDIRQGPSDLEYGLRSHCQRLIVKATPLSGAHLLFTSERIAVRAYYPCDLQELRGAKEEQVRQRTIRPDTADESPTTGQDDFDGLSAFFSSFQLTLVLFVMTPGSNGEFNDSIAQQLDDIDSHFHRAQRLSIRHQQEAEVSAIPFNGKDSQKNRSPSARKSYVLLLPDTESAIQNLIAIADSLAPERKTSKRALLQRLETKFFLPASSASDSNTNADPRTEASPATVAAHVEEGLREIARIFEFPPGEVNILMSGLGDLKTIATADDSLLATIPIDRRTRKILHTFFGSSLGSSQADTSTRTREPQPPEQIQPQQTLLSSVATELFPHSNSSLSPTILTQNYAKNQLGTPSARPFQGHHQLLQAQSPLQHSFDASMASEYWMEPNDAQDSHFAPFYPQDDDIFPPDDENAFDMSNNEASSSILSRFAAGRNPIAGRDRPMGIHRQDSQFSAVNPPASSSVRSGNTSNPYTTLYGQSYHGGLPFRRQQMPQEHGNPFLQRPYIYPVDQPTFPNQYAQSQQPLMFQNRINPATTNPLPFSSSRQREPQQRRNFQNFSHKRAFRR